MRVSEKSLELNVGAEVLMHLRAKPAYTKAYLRGLTQREERLEGVDFFARLPAGTRLFAFQFKAPKGSSDTIPFRYTLVQYQHDLLYKLGKSIPGSVFYVFPFYATTAKLHRDLPRLSHDTWLLDAGKMPTAKTFAAHATRTIKCDRGTATVNPEFQMLRLSDTPFSADAGIGPDAFARWYTRFRATLDTEATGRKAHRSPWLARGLRISIAIP